VSITTSPERGPAVLLQSTDGVAEHDEKRKARRLPRSFGPVIYALILGGLWVGGAVAFFWGYLLVGPHLIFNPPLMVLVGFATLVPPLLMIGGAWALARGQAMSMAAHELVDATDSLFTTDEASARTAARLGRVVRRELDALNAGLDGAFNKLRALETVLENQISSLDEAGARADVRAEAAASRLAVERERLDGLAGSLSDAAARASEVVAGRAAQLKANIESAEGTLKAAGVALEGQVSNFRTAADAAAEAPHTVAVELDRQSKRIEQVSDAAMARAEFVLGRQERHRGAMMELVQRLKDDGAAFEGTVGKQTAAMEAAVAAVGAQAEAFEALFTDADRKLELLVATSATRTTQLAASISREVERLKDLSENADSALTRLLDSLREAGVSAQTLIGETSTEAKVNARELVGDAMVECERLLRAAGELSAQSKEIKETLTVAVEEMQNHLLTLPGVAKQEAQRVRDLVRVETEEILDLSARTLSTIHARTVVRNGGKTVPETTASEEPESEGLLGLARRFTQRGKRKDDSKSWEISTLLAAAETNDAKARGLNPEAAAALAALQTVLADLAIDLDAIAVDEIAGEDQWRRYLAGDRSIFARRLATAMDAGAIDRITQLYRDNPRFRDAANVYIGEFESLLALAREGDGGGGLLASTILSADTGKIYLTFAYALGRLS
jgi:hypothetical protein